MQFAVCDIAVDPTDQFLELVRHMEVASEADTERRSATGQVVDGRDADEIHRRMARQRVHDVRPEPEPT